MIPIMLLVAPLDRKLVEELLPRTIVMDEGLVVAESGLEKP